jgi:hypothetical protein
MRSPFPGRRSGGRSAVALSLLLVGVVAACGASGAAAPPAAPREANGGNLPAASAAPANLSDLSPDASPAGAASGSGSGSNGDGGDQAAIFDDTKIVRTGTLQMTVDDVAKALAGGRDAIRNLGGYIGASQQERSDDKTVASVTYRIPVARWEDALDALRGLGTEVAEKTDAAEVTGQIVDLGARITNLKASEAALVGYAEKAPKVSDLLEIQARLTDTRGQIERLTAQQASLQDQAALATLTVTFGTDVVAVQETAQRWDPAAEVDRASATLIGIGQALVSVGIVFLIVWLPLILAISIVAMLTLFVLRRAGLTRPNRLPPLPPLAPPPTSAEL